MTPQEIKNSILQLAIQGNLVEQRPEEGTAADLLIGVKTDEQVDGHRVKEKEISKISDDDIPFDLPVSWKWVKLGSVCTIARGGSPRPIKDYITDDANGVNWIKIGDTEKNGKYISSTAEKIKPSGISKSRMVHAGDFLLTNSMSFGRPYILKTDGCIHDGWLVISQGTEVFDQDYLYWTLSSGYAYSQFCGKVSGAVVKNLNSDKVANTLFPLPPLAEQKRIVAKIEELLPLIERYEKAWSRLEDFNNRFPTDMQKSILQMAIQGRLVEQRPEEGTGEELYRRIKTTDAKELEPKKRGKGKSSILPVPTTELPFEIPDSWIWVRLGTIGYTNIGLTYSPKDVSGEGTLVLRSSNIQNGLMDYEDIVRVDMDIPENKICCKGDILICARNGSKRLVGKSAIIDRDGMSFGAFMAIFRSPCNEFIIHVINSAYFRNSLLGETGTTTINQITQDMLKNALIPLPPLAEQKRIVARLEELLPLCERLK